MYSYQVGLVTFQRILDEPLQRGIAGKVGAMMSLLMDGIKRSVVIEGHIYNGEAKIVRIVLKL